MNFGDIGGVAFSILGSAFFWLIFTFGVLIVSFGSLYIRKSRKLIYPTYELCDLGHGKIGMKPTFSGWFKRYSILFGLYDMSGEEVVKLKDGREVQGASSKDFHEINGKRGLFVIRKPDDPKVLLPISRMKVINEYLMLEIAPADYRDTAVKLADKATQETLAKWEKVMPYIAIGFMCIMCFICIILVIQMHKGAQTEASKMILEAGKIVATAKSNVVAASGAAP